MPKITFQESELEDFLCKDNNLEKYLGLRFVARQVKTPNGIVDILAYNKETKSFVIIELKRENLDSSAYFQIQRYYHYFDNKYPRKRFQKLLIGHTLHSDLNYSVVYWSEDETPVPLTYYRLFSYDFDHPFSLDWFSRGQRDIEDGRIYMKDVADAS